MKLSPPGTLSCALVDAVGDGCWNEPVNGEELIQAPDTLHQGEQFSQAAAYGETSLARESGLLCRKENQKRKKKKKEK